MVTWDVNEARCTMAGSPSTHCISSVLDTIQQAPFASITLLFCIRPSVSDADSSIAWERLRLIVV